MFITKKLHFLLGAFLITFLIIGTHPVICEEPKDQEEKAQELSYKVINEEISDTEEKTSVLLTIHVTGDITKDPLKELLNKLYNETLNRTDFTHHPSPNKVKIYAFSSAKNADPKTNTWLARLIKGRYDTKPNITVNASALRALKEPPEKKKKPKSEAHKKAAKKTKPAKEKSKPELELSADDALTNKDLDKVLYYEEALYGSTSYGSGKAATQKEKSNKSEKNEKVLNNYKKAVKFFKQAKDEQKTELYQKALKKASAAIDSLVNMGEKEKYEELVNIIEISRSILNKQKIKEQK